VDQSHDVRRIVYTPREAAELIGVSKTTIYRWMDAGEIAYVQMGKDARKLIPKAPFLEKFGLRSAP
jgi:excisionase family DNA binding protein